MRQVLLKTVMFFGLISASLILHAKDSFAIVGTGGVTGVYYPAGGSVCRMVNRKRDVHGIRCAVESTQGSVYNLQKVRELDLDFAVVQSDWQYHALHGSGVFQAEGADAKLRSIFALYAEPFTVVTRADSGVTTFEQLKGKRVNIGNVGSGQRATMELLMSKLGWKHDDFSEVHEFKSADQAEELCKGTFDAMVFVVGHPSASIKEAVSSCDSRLVPVTGEKIDQLVADHDYYRYIDIPGGMYRNNDQSTRTFGVSATFVTSEDVSETVVYEVTKAVFENFEYFKQLHPAFQGLSKKEMINQGLAAPLHSGARRYLREARMLD